MKIHTTNYTNTLIEIAEDSPVSKAVIPLVKNEKKTIANYQFEKLSKKPLKYTSDELLFEILRNEMTFRLQKLKRRNRNSFRKVNLVCERHLWLRKMDSGFFIMKILKSD